MDRESGSQFWFYKLKSLVHFSRKGRTNLTDFTPSSPQPPERAAAPPDPEQDHGSQAWDAATLPVWGRRRPGPFSLVTHEGWLLAGKVPQTKEGRGGPPSLESELSHPHQRLLAPGRIGSSK